MSILSEDLTISPRCGDFDIYGDINKHIVAWWKTLADCGVDDFGYEHLSLIFGTLGTCVTITLFTNPTLEYAEYEVIIEDPRALWKIPQKFSWKTSVPIVPWEVKAYMCGYMPVLTLPGFILKIEENNEHSNF